MEKNEFSKIMMSHIVHEIHHYEERVCNNLRSRLLSEHRPSRAVHDRAIDALPPDLRISRLSPMAAQRLCRMLSMNAGIFWQKYAGAMPGWRDLGSNHLSGLDLESDEFVVEMKNAIHTDNADSKKRKFEKLIRYAEERGKIPLYGVINDSCQHPDGRHWTARCEPDGDRMIHVRTGEKFLRLVFGEHLEEVTAQIMNHLLSIREAYLDLCLEN